MGCSKNNTSVGFSNLIIRLILRHCIALQLFESLVLLEMVELLLFGQVLQFVVRFNEFGEQKVFLELCSVLQGAALLDRLFDTAFRHNTLCSVRANALSFILFV